MLYCIIALLAKNSGSIVPSYESLRILAPSPLSLPGGFISSFQVGILRGKYLH